MKKILFLICLMFMGASAMAQNIVYDQTTSNVRTVITNSMLVSPTDGHEIVSLAIAGFETQGIRRYALAASIRADHKFNLPNHGKLYIYLNNGKMLTLEGTKGGESILQSVDVYEDKIDQLTTRYNYYTLPKKLVKNIKKAGIQRIEIDMEPQFESNVNTTQLGNLIVNGYNMLETTLKRK